MSSCAAGMSRSVTGYCHTLEGATGSASLNLLRDIDRTIDALLGTQKAGRGLIELVTGITETINSSPCDQPLDTDNVVESILVAAENELRGFLDILVQKRHSAISAPELQGDHGESIVTEYDSTVDIFETLLSLHIDLKWAYMEHEAELEEAVGEVFASPDDIIRALKTG